MTATQDKWLDNLPHSSEALGMYWAYDLVAEYTYLVVVEWCEETATYRVRAPEMGGILIYDNFNEFFQYHYLLRVEKPDIGSSDWIDTPEWAGYHWAHCIETQEIFAVVVGSGARSFESLGVFSSEYGLIQPHPNHSLLRGHRWLEMDEPSPPSLSFESDEWIEIEKRRGMRKLRVQQLEDAVFARIRAEKAAAEVAAECST